MNKKAILSITLASALTFTGTIAFQREASASQLSDLQNQKQKLQQKNSSIDKDVDKNKDKISSIKAKQVNVKDEIARLSKEMKQTDNKIKEQQTKITETNNKITQLKKSIEETKLRIKERNKVLKQRARTAQTDGEQYSFVNMLTNAESIGDFIDKVSAMTMLYKADRNILSDQKKDEANLKQEQSDVEKKLADIKQLKSDLEANKSSLSEQKADRDNLMKELKNQKHDLETENVSKEEEKELLAGQQKALEKAIQLEKDRIEEEKRKAAEEAKRKAAEEAAQKAAEEKRLAEEKQAAQQAQQAKEKQAKQVQQQEKPQVSVQQKSVQQKSVATPNTSSSTPSIQSRSITSSPSTPSSTFIRPADAYVTSEFGGRDLPGTSSFHPGIDVAKAGTVPIVAVADGVVASSYTSSSYGEVVMITHYINGKQITSVYAHMRTGSRTVQAGQTVKQGQRIGYMGETGQAFGQHLHFEMYNGGWTPPPHNGAVNPRTYINF